MNAMVAWVIETTISAVRTCKTWVWAPNTGCPFKIAAVALQWPLDEFYNLTVLMGYLSWLITLSDLP